MRYPLDLSLNISGDISSIQIPPMLIIPLVENVFKHGVDKRKDDNYILIDLQNTGKQLKVKVENRLIASREKSISGKGLANLKNRLGLLYGENGVISAVADDSASVFTANLTIPL